MEELTYRRASTLPLERIVEAFNRSFEGYFVPMVHSIDSLRSLIAVNDVSLAHSVVAMDADDRPMGVVLMAVRGSRGWIGGMGLAPAWRGHGQAAPLMQAAITEARTLGLAAVGLEVLAQNAPARRLYTRLGFVNVRTLAVFTGPLANDASPLELPMPVQVIPVESALTDFAVLHQVPSPWQRDLPALEHMAPTLSATALLDGQAIRASLISMPSKVGYSVMDFGSCAKTAEARRDDAIALIRALVAPMPDAPVRAINVPPGDALGDALTTLGCPTPHMQWEMTLSLG